MPIACRYGDDADACSSNDVKLRAAAEKGVLVTGPSGCAKTLLSYNLAIAALDQDALPIAIAARDFEGSLRDAADREVALLGAPSARAIISACRRLGRRLLLVVDGYNECPEPRRTQLTRSVAGTAHRYEARIVISGQTEPERAELLRLKRIVVSRPSSCQFAGQETVVGNVEPRKGAFEQTKRAAPGSTPSLIIDAIATSLA